MVGLNALTRHLQPQVIQARERAQVWEIKGSMRNVEVFQMDGVGISIIERPRPLHSHDTPNPAHHIYTLKCEEPDYSPLTAPPCRKQLQSSLCQHLHLVSIRAVARQSVHAAQHHSSERLRSDHSHGVYESPE